MNELTSEKLATRFVFNLIRRRPFYGNAIIRMDGMVPDEGIEIACAGITSVKYNPNFIQHLIDNGMVKVANYIYIHEFYHILFCHATKGIGKHHKLYNYSADFLINALIVTDSGLMSDMELERPDWSLWSSDPQFILKRTTDEIYDILYAQYIEQGGEEDLLKTYHFKLGEYEFQFSNDLEDILNVAGTLSEEKLRELEQELREKLLGSGLFDSGNLFGNTPLGAHLRQELEEYLGVKIKWYQYVRRFLTSQLSDELSLSSPDKNFLWQDLILPGRSEEDSELENIVVSIDTSGSTISLLPEFIFHMKSLCSEFNVSGNVILWDADVQGEISLERFLEKPDFIGGGGTNPNPMISLVNRKYRNASCMIVLTDGIFNIPRERCFVKSIYVLSGGKDIKGSKTIEWLEKTSTVCYT